MVLIGLLGANVCLCADDKQVVEETSAVLPDMRFLVLDSDHLKLSNFTGLEDGNYVSVSSNLARIAAQASRLRQARRDYNQMHDSIHIPQLR
jgi:hypothetical protein